MIYRRCPRCRQRIPSGSKCGCAKQRYKEYDRTGRDRKTNAFYRSAAWRILREQAKARYMGIDIYSFYARGRIEHGHSVHHIIPIKDDWSKRLELDNLIYLTEQNHQLVHAMLQDHRREEIIQRLQDHVLRFKKEHHIQGGI